MKHLVIHIGMSKTGSSSIQRTLSKTRQLPRFEYLWLDEANAGRHLATAFMAEPERMQSNRKRGLDKAPLMAERERVLAAWAAQLRADADLFVLSSEMISLLDRPALTALRDWLTPQVDRISLLGYVREPASYMESMFQQSLKAGNARFDLARRYPAYQERFGSLEAVFGRERLQYKLFAPARFAHQCVVRDFLQGLGRELDGSEVVRVNDGLSAAAVGLLFIYRRHGPALGEGARALRGNRRLIQALRSLEGPKFRLSAALVRPILAAMQDDMDWMAERLGEPLPVRLADDTAGTVGSEDDLLRLSPAAVDWLVAHTAWRPRGDEAAPGRQTLEAVAQALHGLRGRDTDADEEPSADDAGAAAPAGAGRRQRGARAAARRAAGLAPAGVSTSLTSSLPASSPGPVPAPSPRQPPTPGDAARDTSATVWQAAEPGDGPADWPADDDLLARIRQLHPALAVDDAALRDIVASVLQALHQTLANRPKSLQLTGLGHFTTRGGGSAEDGQPGRVRILLKLQDMATPAEP